jgi:hypothetical protein
MQENSIIIRKNLLTGQYTFSYYLILESLTISVRGMFVQRYKLNGQYRYRNYKE